MKSKLLAFSSFVIVGILSFTMLFNNSPNDNVVPTKKQTSSNILIEDDLQEVQKKTIQFKKPVSEKKRRVKGVIPKDSPNLFAQWYNDIRTMPGKSIPDYKMNYQIDELTKVTKLGGVKALSKSTNTSIKWKEVGPGNVSGRTRSILIHPDNPDTWYVGSVGGGVWLTTDAGQNWTNLTKDLPNLATSALAWSESNPNIIYVGTGEGFGNVDQIDGSGMWKTTNGGISWKQLASTATMPEFENVMRLAVSPTNPDIIVAAVAPGFNYLSGTSPTSCIYRSEDGGENWTKTYDAGSNNIEDLRANPLNFNIQYAAIHSKTVIKSTDGGKNWIESGKGIGAVQRMEIAISPTDTNKVYIGAQGGKTGSILYSTNDGGATWYSHVNADNKDVNWLGGQGWYDNTIVVNPYNSNQVYLGGVQLWKADVSSDVDTSELQVTGVDTENISSFLNFVNFGGKYAGGGIDDGKGFHGLETNVADSDFAAIEIRFGPGKKQMAHRFSYAQGFQYPYIDYVEVPFEVWDTTNNRQLMVSFRDWNADSTWLPADRSNGISREYIFVNAIEYDSQKPDSNITKIAGMAYKNIYAIWLEAVTGVTLDADNLPESLIRINWDKLLTKGIDFTNIADAYTRGAASKGIHVDHHNLVIVKTDTANKKFRLLNGNDGGVAFSDDKGATFSQTGDAGRVFDPGDVPNEILLGYNTTQFYGIDKANGVDMYVGGTQDNGSWLSPRNPDKYSKWLSLPSGDGYEAAWHYTDMKKIIETSQYNGIYRSIDGGIRWSYIAGGIDNGRDNAPFFTKIGKSKQDPDLIFALGKSGLWRSDNFGSSWDLINMPTEYRGTSSFSQVKISLHNPQIVWTGTYMVNGSTPSVSTDGGLTFKATNLYTETPVGRISGLETHPTEDSTAYVLLATSGTPKILKTTDLGNTWSDISGYGTNNTSSNGFPDVAVYSLLVMPHNTNMIWAGTEIGLFESTDGGATWAYADNGLPPVGVYDMLVVNDEVVVATHGRGVWTATITELNGYEPVAATLSPRFMDVVGGINGEIIASIQLTSAYDSSFVFSDSTKLFTFEANTETVDSTLNIQYPVTKTDTVALQLVAYKGNKPYKSSLPSVIVYPLKEAQNDYANNLNSETDDFFANGFEIKTIQGFDNGAIHSGHNYLDNSNSTITLKVPIIVSDKNDTLKYDDIAIVEPSDSGVAFGNYGFWDYVIVEGSNDNGTTWKSLADGYDARYDSTWLKTYSSSAPANPTMFRGHVVKLGNVFSAGEKILLRFRLFADGNTNGWGWVIDDISLQGKIVGIENFRTTIPVTYNLDQNYPNPFNPTTKINFGLPNDNKVVLKIYDVLGREVATLINKKLKAGYHNVEWNARSLASGIYIYRIEAGKFVESKKMLLLK